MKKDDSLFVTGIRAIFERGPMKKLILLLFLLFISMQSYFCKPKARDMKMVLIFQTADVTVIRVGKEMRASTGFVFQKGDQIKNGAHVADIQSETGSIVRIKPFSQISLSELGLEDKPVTNVYLKAGGMLVRTNKLQKNEVFTVTSPTTIAGVRGTMFSFDLQNGDIPRVKVFEGSVKVAINAELNEITPRDIALNPNFQKLHTFLKENEVIVEAGKEALFDPTLVDLVHLVNERRSVKELEEDLKKFDDKLNNTKDTSLLSAKDSPVTPKEEADNATVVKVEDDLVKNAISSNSDNPSEIKANATIEKDHKKQLDHAITKIESKATEKNLNSHEELQNYYSVLEVVVKTNGEKVSGAVVTQIGDVMILHSPKGVVRISKSEIQEIDYFKFDVKVKKKN